MYEKAVVYVSLCIAFIAICIAVFYAFKERRQRKNEEKRRLIEEEKFRTEIAEKTEKFIRLSSRYFGNMPMTEEEKNEFFYQVLADQERDGMIVWLDLMGLLRDDVNLMKMVEDEEFRFSVNLTFTEYKELYDHMYGPGAYAIEVKDEMKAKIEKFAWLSFRDKPERQKVVEARAMAQRLSQESAEEFLDKKTEYKFKDLDSVRKAYAIKLKELTDFMFKTFPILNDGIDRLKKAEASLWDYVEDFRKARKEADDYHKHLMSMGSPFADPKELEKNIKDIVSKAIVEAMKKVLENEAKLREESIKKAVEEALKPVYDKMKKYSDSFEHYDKLIEDLINSSDLESGQIETLKQEIESYKEQKKVAQSVAVESTKNEKSGLFNLVSSVLWILSVLGILAVAFSIANENQDTKSNTEEQKNSSVIAPLDSEPEFLLSDFDPDFLRQAEEKTEEITVSTEESCLSKQCCVDKYGGNVDSWTQAVKCFKEVEKR
ncbi:MAG TPA: hypothetical protein P5230_00815 [Candidatus Magasanikbacteria bacterium]|nr:hypothetical protein [Candidatus Magasanikbacteria bacterium]